MFQNFDKFSLPDLEEKVLKFWKANHIFEKAEKKNKGEEEFVFYEGPPSANGKPGIHHVLSRSFKDIILRFQTMKGKNVIRRGGWDTHGLPVELEIEEDLGIDSKPEIEEYGVKEFNKKCRESVWEYKDEWERLTERMGFWIDMEHPYITYENSYIETIWWLMSQIDEKGYLYEDHKVVPWCPRCETALSSHELAQGYDEVTEPSVFMKFRLEDGQEVGDVSTNEGVYVVSWTTTPWTLPGNVGLAVGDDIEYSVVEVGGEKMVMASDLIEFVLDDDYDIISKVGAEELEGLSYEPLFDVEALQDDSSYKIYFGDFVTTDEGTGIVHTAVMYGEDDYELGQEVGLPQHHTVDEAGKFTSDVPEMEGDFVKANRVEEYIFSHLEKNNNLLRTEEYTHEYPFCWRCDTPVLYYARNSWFIRMSDLREEMLESNSEINWTPEHIKDGRFGEWLRGAKDWAISRERYWGTPLPVWRCEDCESTEVIKSFEELSSRSGGVNNSYTLMRHGKAPMNEKNIINSDPDKKDAQPLTDEGKKEAREAAGKLKDEDIDLIFASDFKRTRETAEIVSEELGVDMELDKRLREIDTGTFDGEPNKKYHQYFKNTWQKFKKRPPEGENLRDLSSRVWDLVEELEEEYEDKNVLIVTHEYVIWILETVMRGWGEEDSAKKKDEKEGDYIGVGEFREVELLNLPKNEWGMVDPHRPYVDKAEFECEECGGVMRRVEEVMDVWFDSGAMPFAQDHYPFESEDDLSFPADYITEALDQTRGWFYTLLAISTLMDREAPYKNAICLGLVLDEYGRKMSKSRGNTVDPWEMAETYGMDVVRWYFYTLNSPGETKKFDEDGLEEVLRSFVLVLYNSFNFLDIYLDNDVRFDEGVWKSSDDPLDQWMVSRINQTKLFAREKLEDYDVMNAARRIGELVDDLSNWYIRRSRDRLRGDDEEEHRKASSTMIYAFLEISKMISPFTPFLAEGLYQSLKKTTTGYDFEKSIHLESWGEAGEHDEALIGDMESVREIASLALSQREREGIKVRQPLSEVEINSSLHEIEDERLIDLLKDEINVKKAIFSDDIEEGVELDTELTHKLKEEGWFRDLARSIQSVRKDAGLDPDDSIVLGFEGEEGIEDVIRDYKTELMERVGADKIEEKLIKNFDAEKETKIGNFDITLRVRKL